MSGVWLIHILAWAGALAGPLLWLWAVRRLRGAGRIAAAALLVGLWALGVWAFFIEPNLLTVRSVDVRSATWSGPPLRIGVISDTHVGAPHSDPARVRKLVQRMNGLKPDIVMLLGDYAGGHEPLAGRTESDRSAIQQGVAAFSGLKPPLGSIGVLGNHDWWYDGPAIETALEEAGVEALTNEAVLVRRPGGDFWVLGASDPAPWSVADTLAAAKDGGPLLFLTHWPDAFSYIPPNVALTLAGHSHCGQVNLPFAGRLVHASPGAKRWGCGLYDESGRQMFVTSGVGTSILSLRFRAPPEIAIVTLSGDNAALAASRRDR